MQTTKHAVNLCCSLFRLPCPYSVLFYFDSPMELSNQRRASFDISIMSVSKSTVQSATLCADGSDVFAIKNSKQASPLFFPIHFICLRINPLPQNK